MNAPAWKRELITSAKEAERYLIKTVEDMKLPNTVIESCADYGLTFFAYQKCGSQHKSIASLMVDSGKTIDVHYIGIGDNHQNQKLGSLIIKSIIAVAHESKASTIFFSGANWDGSVFLPILGAAPISVPREMRQTLLTDLKKETKTLSPSAQLDARKIIKLAQKKPFHAWHKLTQSRIKKEDGSYLKEKILRRACYQEKLFMNLKSTTTRNILYNRLGALPDFKPKPYKMPRPKHLIQRPQL